MKFNILFKPTCKRIVEKEIDESMRYLLQAQTNMEHWTAQVGYFQTKMKRLKATWNELVVAEEEKNDIELKGKP